METQAPPRKLPFWLILSALINFVLIGFVAGYLLRPGHHRPDRPHREFVDSDTVRLMRDLAQEGRGAMKPHAEARRAAQADLIETLRIEPYDAAAVREKLSAVRTQDAAMRSAMDEALITKLGTLTPVEREQVAKLITEGRDRRHRRRKGREDGPPE